MVFKWPNMLYNHRQAYINHHAITVHPDLICCCQGCIKFLNGLGGKFIKSVGEDYQVVKRGREYHGLWEESNVEKSLGEAISSVL